MSLTFQRSFKLELDNVAKILAAVVEIPFATRHEIAEFTGIPIGKNEIHGKVDPTLIYATYCGLITSQTPGDAKGKRSLTDFGKIVFEYDKKIRRMETRWGIHYFLSSSRNGAPAWSFFTHEFLNTSESFSGADLNRALKEKFSYLSTRYIDENERSLLSCYTDAGALGKLRLIETFQRNEYIRGETVYPSPTFFAYILAELWDELNPERSMVAPEVFSLPGHLQTTFRMPSGDLRSLLDELGGMGLIRQSREAPPFQVIRNWDNKCDLLRQAYEEV